jgi:hypothetical protein
MGVEAAAELTGYAEEAATLEAEYTGYSTGVLEGAAGYSVLETAAGVELGT